MRCASCAGDVVRHQLRVELGTLDLLDVDPDFLAGQVRELVAQLVHLGALLPDDDARTAGVQRHDDLPRLALDHDVRDRRVPEARLQILPQQLVLAQQRRQLAARVVARVPLLARCRGGSRSDWSSVPLSPTPLGHHDLDVAGPLLNRSRASLRGRHEPLELRPLVDRPRASRTARRRRAPSFVDRAACSAFATADFSVFAICFAACFFENVSSASASLTSLPRIWSITSRILYGD